MPALLAGILPTVRPLGVVVGIALLLAILIEGFETLVLPRRIDRNIRFTRFFYRSLWKLWRKVAAKLTSSTRDNFLSAFGPLSLIMLLSLWALGLVVGFGLIFWAVSLPMNTPPSEQVPTLPTYLYFSGVTFITLGYGDVSPKTPPGRLLATFEAGLGFGFLAIVIGYLPVLYGAFSRREAKIALLDARASSPPSAGELLRRHKTNLPELTALLRDWEQWSAELLESVLSYPVLAYYRSQHEQQSWLNSLTVILDACAYVIATHDSDDENDALLWQARLTFAISRHAAVDIAILFSIAPKQMQLQRLTADELCELNANLVDGDLQAVETPHRVERLRELQALYEPYVYVLAKLLVMPLPGWLIDAEQLDNWKTSAWDRSDHFFYVPNA